MTAAEKRIAEQEKQKEMAKSSGGWVRPLRANKHHYFKAGEVVSICGKWMCSNPIREPDTFESADDCAACRKKINGEKGNG